MAELYSFDDDARRAGALRSLIAASKPKATTPAKTDTQKDAELGVSRTAAAPVVDERTQFRAKAGLPPVETAPSFIDPQDVRDPATGLTPAQVAAQKALGEAVTAGAALGITTKPDIAKPGNVPTVTVTGFGYKGKTVVSRIDNGDGTFTIMYSDGTNEITGTKRVITNPNTAVITVANTANATATVTQTTNIDVLKTLLRGMGFTTGLIDSSADYLNRLLKDGLDYDNAIAIFLDSKEYTFKDGQKVTSPFYTAYGYLNEGLTVPKTAAELFNAVEGYKEVINKYALNQKFTSSDSLKKYVKNNVTVAELDERANAARLKAVNADKSYTDALQALGYIKSATDLTDFFLNPDIGKEALEQNRSTAAFSAEAIRRAQQGIKFDAARFSQITAGLMGKGLREEEIGITAATGFEKIGEQIAPMQKLVNVYERQGLPETDVVDLQKELEAEQFLGTTSQRRQRVSELEQRAFQRAPGTTASSLRGARAAGII